MLARSSETADTDDVLSAPADPAVVPARSSAFGRAQRHSRRVRVLKFAVPLLAVAIAIAFPVYSYLVTPTAIPVKAEGSAFSDGKLVMANPKLEGVTEKNLPYSMTAVRAIQDPKNENVIELEGIDAKLPIDGRTTASIDAPHGVYDRETNTLDLDRDVTVKTSDGLVVKLQSAFLDIGEGNMKTDKPVNISRPDSRITADSMKVKDHGKVLVFENNVHVNIDPAKAKAANRKESGDGVQ